MFNLKIYTLLLTIFLLSACSNNKSSNNNDESINSLSNIMLSLDGEELELVGTNSGFAFFDIFSYIATLSTTSYTGLEGNGPFLTVTQPPIDCNSLSAECSISGENLTCNNISTFKSCPKISYFDPVFRFDREIKLSKSGDTYFIENINGGIGYFKKGQK